MIPAKVESLHKVYWKDGQVGNRETLVAQRKYGPNSSKCH